MNGASASTKLSGLPFSGPLGSTRLANINGQWVAFRRWNSRSPRRSTWS